MSGFAAVALASQSPRRRELLQGIGLSVNVIRSHFDEQSMPWQGEPAALALDFARRKAAAAESGGPPLLVAADTIVDVDGAVLGKPRDARRRAPHARAAFRHANTSSTPASPSSTASSRQRVVTASSPPASASLPLDDGADRSLRRDAASRCDKAGAYGIQGHGALYVGRVDGDFYTVMGLPLARVGHALAPISATNLLDAMSFFVRAPVCAGRARDRHRSRHGEHPRLRARPRRALRRADRRRDRHRLPARSSRSARARSRCSAARRATITVIRPMRNGVVSNFTLHRSARPPAAGARAARTAALSAARHGRRAGFGDRRREESGARGRSSAPGAGRVYFVPQAMAAAVGAGLPILEPARRA